MFKSFQRRIIVTYVVCIVLVFMGILLLCLAGFIAWLAYFSTISFPSDIFAFWFFTAFITILAAMGVFVLLWSGRSIFNVRFWKQREKNRQAVAGGNRPDLLVIEQPNGNAKNISLPLKIEMHMRPSLRNRLLTLYGIGMASGIALIIISVLIDGWQALFRTDSLRMFSLDLLFLTLINTNLQKQHWVIDANGIKTGGGFSESILWQNVRFIALYGNKGQPPESFEVASAKTSIFLIWQRRKPPKVWLRTLASVIAPDVHNQQMDDLLAYIFNYTRLPLYDLRED